MLSAASYLDSLRKLFGKLESFSPIKKTTSHSSPFALWIVLRVSLLQCYIRDPSSGGFKLLVLENKIKSWLFWLVSVRLTQGIR